MTILTVDNLHLTLSNDFQIKCFIDLGKISTSIHSIYQIFNQHYQAEYQSNDRLIFYTSHAIPDSLLKHLYQAANLIDISNFFILICSPDNIQDQLKISADTYSKDPVSFQSLQVSDLQDTLEIQNKYIIPDTLCPLPWMHLEVSHRGEIKPCCISKDQVGHISQNIINVFDNDRVSQLRNDLLNGKKNSGCERCWNSESHGLTSNRTHHLGLLKKDLLTKYIISPEIVSIDIKPGNTCNFKCRICNPVNSSLFAQEQAKILNIPAISVDWITNEMLAEQIDQLLPTLKNIDMYGGDPFLIKRLDVLLSNAVDKGYAKNIRLHYNTNGSTFPDQLINLWRHFSHVDIHVSVDNVNKRFELERGGSWEEIDNNVRRLLSLDLPNLKISIMSAISIMNIFYIDEVLTWAKSLNLTVTPNYVHYPIEYSLEQLTQSAKDLLNSKYQHCDWPEMQNILKTINNYPPSDGKAFVKLTQYFDNIRNENFAETHKEIATAMGYVYNKNL